MREIKQNGSVLVAENLCVNNSSCTGKIKHVTLLAYILPRLLYYFLIFTMVFKCYSVIAVSNVSNRPRQKFWAMVWIYFLFWTNGNTGSIAMFENLSEKVCCTYDQGFFQIWSNSPSSKFQLLFKRLIIFFIFVRSLDFARLVSNSWSSFFTDIDLLVHLIYRVISLFIS